MHMNLVYAKCVKFLVILLYTVLVNIKNIENDWFMVNNTVHGKLDFFLINVGQVMFFGQ